MADVSAVLKAAQKDHGDKVTHKGSTIIDYERIPFGIFPLDLALGGGIPEGKMSMVYGPESSGKSNMALLLLASYQKIRPDRTNVFIDTEHNFDGVWAQKLGVDLDNVEVIKPDYAEQAVDIAEGLIDAEDLGLMILDSVAGMVPIAELEGDASRMQVAGNSMVVGKFCRKIASGLMRGAKVDRYPTVFLINQRRTAVGQGQGNMPAPEKYPGGNTLRHYCNVILRPYAKPIIEKAVNSEMPAWYETKVEAKKWKVPITGVISQYKLAMLPQGKVMPGECLDWNTVSNRAKDLGILGKDKNKWYFAGEEFPTLTAIREHIESDPLLGISLRQDIIRRTVADVHQLLPPKDKTAHMTKGKVGPKSKKPGGGVTFTEKKK